jgi:ABC-2 type transport system permease protein
MTVLATALRELWGNPAGNLVDPALPLRHPVLPSVLMLSVLLVAVVPLATRAYDRAVAAG